MHAWLRILLDDAAGGIRTRILAIYGILIAFNLFAWAWAFIAFRQYPVLLATAFLAYSLGLRHAVDADHIAAIDNVTRKLMQDKMRPVAVGFLFALGHSTIVFIGSAIIAATARSLHHSIHAVTHIVSAVGALVSITFLFGIAFVNLIVLRSVYTMFRKVRGGERFGEEELNILLSGRGFLSRIIRPMFHVITKSWHMYPLGVLFGLGFDTATEIGLLGISAAEASKGLPFWSILVFPTLFAAGMSLVDTTDNVLMLGAYGSALGNPVRRIYYSLTITLASVIVAVLVGGVETLGLIAGDFHPQGYFWNAVRALNENLGVLGYFVIAIFLLSWVVAVSIYKWRRYDEIEATPASSS